MVINVFKLLPLAEVFLLVLSVPYKYVLVQQEKTWSDAQAYCQANYIDSAIPNGTDYMVKLQTEAEKQGFTSSAWIGLYNDMHWRWSLGNQSLGAVTDWCPATPDNLMENCVVFGSCWCDISCADKQPFVCVDERNTGSSRFIVISTAEDFQDAQIYCRRFHTDLASLTTSEDILILKQIVSSSTWIGLFRGGWQWTDQSKLYNWIWDANPWSAPLTHTCGSFSNGRVNPTPCSDKMPFFCFSDFTQKKLMKIKVQSNQDMNDPAIKADILQKIKKKLEEHGISYNSTVKWRERPDGKVFQKIIQNTVINVTGENVTCNFSDP